MALHLHLYNTLTRATAPFVPLNPGHVRLYVCGPTVYDVAHIGNARPVVVFDVLVRLLRHLFPRVTYVRNITDIDDKIINRAAQEGRSIADLTQDYAARFAGDMAALGALPPDIEPRATEHVPGMLALIQDLIARGHAYAAEGHVLFHVPSFPAYGSLSRRPRDEQIAGARVEVAPYKRDPADFVLWKPSAADQPGWDSPYGRGRPGWHIECSAMAAAHLGVPFDIHGGGIDLIFPHHENEVAQSCCGHGVPTLAQVWMHNGFVLVEGEKMAKSAGNFTTPAELMAEGIRGEAIRLTLLSAHYRQPLDFSRDRLGQAAQMLDRFYTALRDQPALPTAEADPAVMAALADDLNVPQALARLHEVTAEVFRAEGAERQEKAAVLRASASMLGLLQQDPTAWFTGTGDDQGWIEAQIAARKAARSARDFARADQIRQDLLARGIALEDGPGGTIWKRL